MLLLLSLRLSLFDPYYYTFGLAMGRPPRKESTRYFTQELTALPLDPLDGPSSLGCCDSSHPLLPILYTNDPRAVSQWLAENVNPGGCILGFDVEVRLLLCFSGASRSCSFVLWSIWDQE